MDLSLIPEADRLDFEEIIWYALSKYKQLVDDDDWTPGPRSTTLAAEPTLYPGYKAALPTEPVAFQTMMCQDISTDVAADMSASTQATPYPPKGGDVRGGRGG